MKTEKNPAKPLALSLRSETKILTFLTNLIWNNSFPSTFAYQKKKKKQNIFIRVHFLWKTLISWKESIPKKATNTFIFYF